MCINDHSEAWFCYRMKSSSEEILMGTGGNYWLCMTDTIAEELWRWYGTTKYVMYLDLERGKPDGNTDDCALFDMSFQYDNWKTSVCKEETMYFIVLLVFVSFCLAFGDENLNSTRCSSIIDYDLKLMQKINEHDTKFDVIEETLEEYFGLDLGRQNKGCPNGWVTYSGSCYYFGSSYVTLAEAEDLCRVYRSYSVRVETLEENEFLKGFIKNHTAGGNHWLGMTDTITEGLWRWYGTTKYVKYFDWGRGEPDGNAEDCALFHTSFQYGWADVPCTSIGKPLCEM